MDPVRADSMLAELTGKIVGGWTVRRLIGSGKSAVVLEAEQNGLVGALKVFDRELVERFGGEVQKQRLERELSLKGVHHDNLVRILDGGYDDTFKAWFVVMEFLLAKTLSDVLDKVPRDRIWPLIAQVARAARFLEDRELCHRDIKPDNIAVSPDYEHATLLDLGVLKPLGTVTEPPITDEDELVFIGTLQYASPEFMKRVEANDLEGWRELTFYQLGTVLHDLIMQRRIFADAKPYARLVSAVENDNPKVHADDVPADLILLTQNCLIKDPALRTRFVTWESFEPPAADADPAVAARERVRRRINLGQATPAVNEWEKERETTVALRDVLMRVDDAIRDACTASNILPPASFKQALTATASEGYVTVQFTPTQRHQLATHLTFCFRIRLVDTRALVVQIDGLAATSPAPLSLTPECGTPMAPVFEGTLEERSARHKFESVLLTAFDAAQTAAPATTMHWLFSAAQPEVTP